MPIPIDTFPPAIEERITCSIVSAVKYEIPANIMLAIAAQEGGKPGQWNKNKNGTHDVGALQFNTDYLKTLKKYGITATDVERSGCYPYELAAWRIRGHIVNDKGDLWTRVANYHSRTPKYNSAYRIHIMQRAEKWADWLDANYNTSIDKIPKAVYQPTPSGATSVNSLKSSYQYVPRQLITEHTP